MAKVLSVELKNLVTKSKSYLKKNDLDGFYRSIRHIEPEQIKEVSEWLISIIGNDIFKYLTKIPEHFLFNSSDIDKIIISGQVNSIGNSAFEGSNLVDVVIENGVETIGSRAFASCENLRSISLGDISAIGSYAFNGCKSLNSIYLPESVRMLGSSVFSDNTFIKSPRRKRGSLRFPKNELNWYKNHLFLDSQDTSEEVE